METSLTALLSEPYDPPRWTREKLRIRLQHADGKCSVVEVPADENGSVKVPGANIVRILGAEVV